MVETIPGRGPLGGCAIGVGRKKGGLLCRHKFPLSWGTYRAPAHDHFSHGTGAWPRPLGGLAQSPARKIPSCHVARQAPQQSAMASFAKLLRAYGTACGEEPR